MMSEARGGIEEGIGELEKGEAASATLQQSTEGIAALCLTVAEQLEPVTAALAQLLEDDVMATGPEASERYKAGARLIHRTLRGAHSPANDEVRTEAFRFDNDEAMRTIGKRSTYVAREIEGAAQMAREVHRRLGDIAARLEQIRQADTEVSARSTALRQRAGEVAEGLS